MSPDILTKTVFILGALNIIFIVLVILTCRCMMPKSMKRLFKYKWYKKFYHLHKYFWWFFIISVFLHAVLAIIVYGNPF